MKQSVQQCALCVHCDATVQCGLSVVCVHCVQSALNEVCECPHYMN